jgi:hypothetical protein
MITAEILRGGEFRILKIREMPWITDGKPEVNVAGLDTKPTSIPAKSTIKIRVGFL